ncbi:MAG: hypothetical protein ACREBM_05955 [Sphingomicrobium sp.]
MRQSKIAAMALLLAACGDSTDNAAVSAKTAAPTATTQEQNLDNELIDQGNGLRVLRLEGNDSVTFVGGEIVEVNRVP